MQTSSYTSVSYFHRDLSWLLFNRRVIEEAQDDTHPLLERMKFLAIASNNADEFFMIRVPGVQSLARVAKHKTDSRTGWTQEEVLHQLFKMQEVNSQLQYQLFDQLTKELAQKNYHICHFQELDSTLKAKMTTYFKEMILPALTPIGLDAYHAFPKIVEKKLHLFVHVKQGTREERAIIPLPALFSRYVQVEGMRQVILLEDLIQAHLSAIFVGWDIVHSFVFRITYDKDLEFEEDTEENLFIQMEEYVLERTKGLPSRLEISQVNGGAVQDARFLSRMLELKERDSYMIRGPLDLTYLFEYTKELSRLEPSWVFSTFTPRLEQDWTGDQLFATLDKNDVLLHHPYDSYEAVVSFIESAAMDPDTVAIKQTLYRMAKNSRIVQALKLAAKQGKQVTALVELKARFDEENNLHWVQELEEAGCYVTYGLQHLKTHSKATLIVKKRQNALHQYVHIGTGNYNESTATLYTDLSLFSSKPAFVEDVTAFFNYLSGYRELPKYQKIAVSPEGIRELLLEKIQTTAHYYQEMHQGKIFFKLNSLTDPVIIDALYEASQTGVPIELIVRGSCCLRPGIEGLSESIQVKSIVGRFLEHSRIYAFETNRAEYWLSSADAMTRNMLLRVEIAAPIEEQVTQTKLTEIVAIYHNDQHKAYHLQADGNYVRVSTEETMAAQTVFMKQVVQQSSELLPIVSQAAKLTEKVPWFTRMKQKWRQ